MGSGELAVYLGMNSLIYFANFIMLLIVIERGSARHESGMHFQKGCSIL